MSTLREKNTSAKTSSSGKNRRMSEVVLDDNEESLTVENVLKELDLPCLRGIAKEKNISPYISRNTRGDQRALRETYTNAIAKAIRKLGYKHIFNSLPKSILLQCTEHLELEYLTTKVLPLVSEEDDPEDLELLEKEMKEKVRNGLPSVLLAKRCYKKIEESSLQTFLEEVKDRNLLDLLLCLLEGEDELVSRTNRNKILNQIYEEFEAFSMKMFFEGLSVLLLKDLCYQMYIESSTVSKKILAECIVYGFSYDDIEVEEREAVDDRVRSKKPKQIDSHITKVDLVYWFKVEELKQFLKDNNLITTGKKNQLANRIMLFFEDPEAATNKFNPEMRKENRKNRRNRNKDVQVEEEEHSFDDMEENSNKNEGSEESDNKENESKSKKEHWKK